MKILFNVNSSDEFGDSPSTAIVEFTKESIERMLRLNEVVKELDVIKICDWDTIEWLSNNPTPHSRGSSSFTVRSHSVSWHGLLKHTNVEYSTHDSIDIDTLKEMLKIVDVDILIYINHLSEVLKVLNTPEKDLPLLINDLKSEEANKILTKRLGSHE